MDDKVLGKLIVIESKDPDCPGSHLSYQGKGKNGEPRYALFYCPESSSEGYGDGIDTHDAKTIIAHELGHFLGNILRLPEHAKMFDAAERKRMAFERMDFDTLFNSLSMPPKLPHEREAWDVAEDIAPGSSKTPSAIAALATYEDH